MRTNRLREARSDQRGANNANGYRTAASSLHVATRGKKTPRRRWHLETQGIRRLGSKSSGFRYVTAAGRPLSDERSLERIRKLRVPPAWRDVRIARSESSPLQAIGYDKKGRLQYRYHLKFRQRRDDEKFLRVVHFGESLPRLRRRVRADLARQGLDRRRVLAAIVRLTDQGFFRPGNENSARQEETFGLTTLRTQHARVNGSRVSFEYVGKWKKKQSQSIADRPVANIVRELSGLKGRELFKFVDGQRVCNVKNRHVNDYIQSIIGEHFTTKDFRTWAGTLLCSIALASQEPPVNQRQQRLRIRKAIEATAKLLGNTPAVCRSSYICPRLLEEYVNGRPLDSLRKKGRGSPLARVGLSAEEKALLRLFRETIADRRRAPRAA
jgi:DNA topoisomerase-1